MGNSNSTTWFDAESKPGLDNIVTLSHASNRAFKTNPVRARTTQRYAMVLSLLGDLDPQLIARFSCGGFSKAVKFAESDTQGLIVASCEMLVSSSHDLQITILGRADEMTGKLSAQPVPDKNK